MRHLFRHRHHPFGGEHLLRSVLGVGATVVALVTVGRLVPDLVRYIRISTM